MRITELAQYFVGRIGYMDSNSGVYNDRILTGLVYNGDNIFIYIDDKKEYIFNLREDSRSTVNRINAVLRLLDKGKIVYRNYDPVYIDHSGSKFVVKYNKWMSI